jgi:hypothetical protein
MRNAILSFDEQGWSALCPTCGKRRGPLPNISSLSADWYDLIEASTAGNDIEKMIMEILTAIPDGKEIEWSAFLESCENKAIAKRVVFMLSRVGILLVRHVVDGMEVELTEALSAKASGRRVEIWCSRKSCSGKSAI